MDILYVAVGTKILQFLRRLPYATFDIVPCYWVGFVTFDYSQQIITITYRTVLPRCKRCKIPGSMHMVPGTIDGLTLECVSMFVTYSIRGNFFTR